MRISTQQIYTQAMRGIQDQQTRLSKTQQQLSSGKRLPLPSEDPSAAVRIQELKEGLATSNQYLDNMNILISRLQLEDSTLSAVNQNILRFRELVIQGGSDIMDGAGREALALEMRELLQSALALANTQDSNGEYIFAGTETETMPFANVSGGFTYFGNDSEHEVRISNSRTIANGDPGSEVFLRILNGNGTFATAANAGNTSSAKIEPGTVDDPAAWIPDNYTITFTSPTTWQVQDGTAAIISTGTYSAPESAVVFNGVEINIAGRPQAGDSFSVTPSVEQSLFQSYQNMIDLFETPVTSPAEQGDWQSNYNREFESIDQALGRITDTQAQVGARMNAADVERFIQEDLRLYLQTAVARYEDLDYAEAATRFELETVALQAAQQSYVKVNGLSLFNYL